MSLPADPYIEEQPPTEDCPRCRALESVCGECAEDNAAFDSVNLTFEALVDSFASVLEMSSRLDADADAEDVEDLFPRKDWGDDHDVLLIVLGMDDDDMREELADALDTARAILSDQWAEVVRRAEELAG